MHSKQTSRLALGTAILGLMLLSGCGGNGTVSPTNDISNFQAINQGNPNQVRLITVVPSSTQITSLNTNATNTNDIITTAGSTLNTVSALSLCGFNVANLQTSNPTGICFAVNSGTITPIIVNANGTLTLGTQGSNLGYTGGNVSACDEDEIFVGGTVDSNNVLVTLDQEGQGGSGAPVPDAVSDALPAPLTSITANVGIQQGGQFGDDGSSGEGFDLFAANGTNTQMFEDAQLIGTAVSIDGSGTDTVVTDSLFTAQGGNTPNVVVVAAGPATATQLATQGPGINVGSSFAVPNGQGSAAFVSAGFTYLPIAGATATTVPTSATFVFGNSVNGSGAANPAFVVIGTNTPTVPLLIIPVNQQVNQQNGFLNLAQNNPLLIQFDGQAITGLNTPQNLAGSVLSNGFDTQNVFAGVTGSGAGSAQNAFAAAVNPLSDPALLFGNLVGDLNVPIGNENTSLNGNPVTFTSTIFP